MRTKMTAILAVALAAAALTSCGSPRGSVCIEETWDGHVYRSIVRDGPRTRRAALAHAKDWAGEGAPCVAVHVVSRHRAEAIAYREASSGPLRLE
jgi:hypothetical protein